MVWALGGIEKWGKETVWERNLNTFEVERTGHDQEADIGDLGISVSMPTIKERMGLGAG